MAPLNDIVPPGVVTGDDLVKLLTHAKDNGYAIPVRRTARASRSFCCLYWACLRFSWLEGLSFTLECLRILTLTLLLSSRYTGLQLHKVRVRIRNLGALPIQLGRLILMWNPHPFLY